MTSTTTEPGSILLHRVPSDPMRTQLADAIREAIYAGHRDGNLGLILRDVACQLGIDQDAAATALGLGFDAGGLGGVVPDGVRACYASECQHGPDHDPA